MATFQEKYLKYKTKYLVLLNNFQTQNGGNGNIMDVANLSDTPFQNDKPKRIMKIVDTPIQTQKGGSKNIMNVSNLTDTPFQNGGNNDFFNISQLSDTPVQDGGKKKNKKKIVSSESLSEDSNLSTQSSEKSGGSSDEKGHTHNIHKFDKKLLRRDSSTSDTDSDSSDFSLSDSSESILSVLEDSDSDSKT
jgi:hypothetical protein